MRMSKSKIKILTFISVIALSPLLGVLFIGIFENGDASILFNPMALMVGYVFALSPTVISYFFIYLYANYLSQKTDVSFTYSYWLVNLSSVCMLCSLIFPVLMSIYGSLIGGEQLVKAFIPWLAPSLATGLTMGMILAPLWYSYTNRY